MPSSNNKRPGGSDDGDSNGDSPNKIARFDHHHDHQQQQYNGQDGGDYGSQNGSNSASGGKKKGGGGSTRTGQACDRCKIRKIRCDARPGGCSPCLQNNSECKTTDRITGRATSRGHTEVVENENASLKMYLLELQQQLKDHGVEPKPPQAIPNGHMPSNASIPFWGQNQAWDPNQHGAYPPAAAAAATERRNSQTSLLPDFRQGCIGDNYLGVQSGNNWLSPIEGTSLALFGTKIDLAEFMPSDTDPLTSAMSYRTFLSHAFGRAQPFAPPLPPYEQCKVYADWFFRSVTPFTPILHKPDFMNLLDRIHHHNYQPTHAETVMVHMVLAIINFQFSTRNGNEQARQDAMSHYQYALKFIPDLITGHKLEDIQALTLICAQLRNQPRPGAAWMFTNMVMGVALESGLHRSAKAWQSTPSQRDAHHMEMRKRTFWSLLLLHVHISGKLGRPMPLRLEDFDVEIPDAVNDSAPGENASGRKGCSFRAGIEGFKLLRIIIQTYSSIYSVKSTGQYDGVLRHLDKELDEYEAQLPSEFQRGVNSQDEDRVAALYLGMGVAEAHLLLHHPSLCRSSSPQTMQSNLDSCLTWSSRLLGCANILKDLKSLDTTWFSSVNFLAAIFTTLFAYTERRDTITSSDLHRLRQDMDQWLAIFAEVGALVGALPQLQVAIRSIIELSLGNLSRILAARTASAAVASADSSATESQHVQQQPQQTSQQVYDTSSYNNNNNTTSNGGYSHPPPQQPVTSIADTSYVTYPQSAYDNTNLHYPQHAFNPSPSNTTYSNSNESIKPDPGAASLEAQLSNHNNNSNHHNSRARPTSAPQNPNLSASNYLTAFHDTNPYMSQSPMPGQGPNGYPHSGPAAWRHFADHMMMSVVGNDMLHSNSASPTTSGGGTSNGGWGVNGVGVNGVGGMGMNGGGTNGAGGGGGMNGKVDISSMAALVVGSQDQAGGGHGSLGGLHGQVWPLINYSAAGLDG